MVRLHQLLSESSKVRRRQRTILNIQITIIGWLVEVLGFLTIFIGSFILGHENDFATLILQTLSLLFYFIIIPSVIILTDTKSRSLILDSSWYTRLGNLCTCQLTVKVENDIQVQPIEDVVA